MLRSVRTRTLLALRAAIVGVVSTTTAFIGPASARADPPPQVYFEPYTPGATYSSRGRGCGIIVPTLPADNCQILGPVTATL